MFPIPVPTSLTFFLEIIVPGLLGSVLAYPLLPEWARVETGPAGFGGFAAISMAIGFIPFLLRAPLFDLALGRYWLPPHRTYAIKRLQARVDQARKDLAAIAGTDLPPPATFAGLFWKQRLLDMTMVTGPEKARTVYAPTIIGNAYLAVIADLAEHFEVEEHLKGNRFAILHVASAVTRGWFLLPKEIRTETAEAGAVGVALARLAAIGSGLVVVYAIRYAFFAQALGEFSATLLFGLVAGVVARVAYLVAITETYSMLQTIRNLLIPLDRDTVHAFREFLRSQVQAVAQPQAPQPAPLSTPPRTGSSDSTGTAPKP